MIGGGHSLADHALGALFDHTHDGGDHDHDHDHQFDDWVPDRPLTSFGLDIGSSGTQAAFARLSAGGVGLPEVPFHLSSIALTPILPDGSIDEEALWRIVDGFFAKAGVSPDEIDTGAVILTGIAAEGGNAAAMGARVAEMAGDFVCIAAGHHMEALLAAHGSGAVAMSQVRDRRVLLVDIGGGTTKFAIVHDGMVEATAALAAGGRLIVVDRQDRIVRLDRAGRLHSTRAGYDLSLSDNLAMTDFAAIGAAMADHVAGAIEAMVRGEAMPDAVADFMLTPWPAFAGPIDGLLVSGGVAEYVYQRETRHFGDIAPMLGKALRRRIDVQEAVPLLEPGECIRATVLGASSHTVQMSGDTIFLSSHARLLPRRNLPVVRLDADLSSAIEPDMIASAIRARRALLGRQEGEMVVAMRWQSNPSHARLRALAEGIVAGVADQLAAGEPLYVMVEGDIARSLGAILREELAVANEVLVIDGLRLRDFDHVDLGRIRLPSGRVPVTIKSLRFGTTLCTVG